MAKGDAPLGPNRSDLPPRFLAPLKGKLWVCRECRYAKNNAGDTTCKNCGRDYWGNVP